MQIMTTLKPLMLVLGLLSSYTLLAQSKNWVLPKHQVTLAYGRGYQTVYYNDLIKGTNVWGVSYTYNISRHFYVTAEALSSYGSYKWTNHQLDPVNFPTPQKDRLPVFKSNDLYGNPNIAFKKNDQLALIGERGFAKCNYAAVHFGYMKSIERNLFRVGIGVGNSWNKWRDIRVIGVGNGSLSYIHEVKNTLPNWCGTINYDYFFNQHLSAGMRLVLLNGFEFHDGVASAQLSVGYAFVGKKQKPLP
jgi:hypothetical protein